MIRDEKIEQGKFVFEVSYISAKGGRPINEDSIGIENNELNILFSIADGLGAHGGGDVASKIAIDVAKEKYMKINKTRAKNIYDIFRSVDQAIVEKQTTEVKMKTTLSCVLFKNKWIYSAHLGDSRIYIFKNNEIIYISPDHSLAYETVMKNGGTLEDIRLNPTRHILNAALGVGKIRPPDIFKQKIGEDVSVLICSDGFWEYVNENEMHDTLTRTATAHKWLEAMMKHHSEKADEYNDNYSAICLKIIKK